MNGSELRNLRLRLSFTQKELAHEIRVNPNTIARWERGEIPISEESSSKILSVAMSNPSQISQANTQIYPIDDLHNSILQALEGKLNPELFEQCAVDLIGQDIGGVVLVGGVKDRGFDGAVWDKKVGEPTPLIVTTAKDILSNLKRNLNTLKKNHLAIKQVMFATSRRVTSSMRRKLSKATIDRGITLTQIYDLSWFASKLYRSPNWCQKLLGLTGQPCALSPYPISPRRQLNNELFGRELEIQWLLNHKSDCVIEGVPGSGKTFLLETLVAQGNALFLTEWNWQQIARDIRKLKPDAIIVDDAHICIEKISKLDQLRHEVHALSVRIIASSWPSGTKEIVDALRLLDEDKLTLKLIDADTMVNIIRSVGLNGPDELISTIKHQAEGRPGLAVTLTDTCLKGKNSDIHKVLSGELLLDQIFRGYEKSLGVDNPKILLTPFALGGKSGIFPEHVANYFNCSKLEITKNLVKLGTTGIIYEHFNGAISVVPGPLQSVLVYQAICNQTPRLDYEILFRQVVNYLDFVEVLIDAHAIGAWIPNLEEYLESTNAMHLWDQYAWHGSRQAEYVIRKHPELILRIAQPALLHLPEMAIPLLLDRVNMERILPFETEDEATRTLRVWVERALPEQDNVLAKRKILLQSAIKWNQQNDKIGVAVRAMLIALTPNFEHSTFDPGSGTTMTIRRGLLSNQDLCELTKFWPTIFGILQKYEGWSWTELLKFVSNWIDAEVYFRLSNDTKKLMQDFSKRIVLDLINIANDLFFVHRRLLELAKILNLDVEADRQLDWELELLFPKVDESNWNKAQMDERDFKLVQYWRKKRPKDLAKFLDRAKKEAARLDKIALPTFFLEHLARCVTRSLDFAETLVIHEIPYEFVRPFAQKASDCCESKWDEFAESCLKLQQYRQIGVEMILTNAASRIDLVRGAILAAEGVEDRVRLFCTINDLPRKTLYELFQAGNSSLAISAAIGHWFAVETNEFTDYRDSEWKQAILRSACGWEGNDVEHYNLERILISDLALAENWLCNLVESNEFVSFQTTKMTNSILDHLNVNQRCKILNSINSSFRSSKIVQHIVGHELSLYRILLSLHHLAHVQLAPLHDPSEKVWPKKVLLALDANFSDDEIVSAVRQSTVVRVGRASESSENIRKQFELLIQNPDVRLRRLGARGVEIYDSEIEKQQNLEYHQAILGFA